MTPTGVSLVKALSTAFGEPPAFIPTHTGVGAGTKEFPFHANIVRVAIGKKIDPNTMAKAYVNPAVSADQGRSIAPVAVMNVKSQQQDGFTEQDVVVLETNLDDLNPQVVGFVFEQLLSSKLALDVWTQPIQMKKSRPGICLRCVKRCIAKVGYWLTWDGFDSNIDILWLCVVCSVSLSTKPRCSRCSSRRRPRWESASTLNV